ncbi:hypothetical protein PFICI_04177 [Pestalotiopsis fici W106-1]|uniref:Xylanolytic transcriptional activator regulatory domain-containing protein n=1 Tax=Pestalotiopsis fici (strain W106-1 / CGMCC3.15140) TaxID=1229662 RepID=W3XL03_PESFW|nr:uncharacterized protein PFICI_04177 [Pestalotiopsis fici W106-1]ETS86152.1 hypothetical protein PFICI_04177 [Pestalotiopsis fici W106-1]
MTTHDEMTARMDRLESLIARVCEAADLKGDKDSESKDLEASISTLIDRLCAERNQQTSAQLLQSESKPSKRLEPKFYPTAGHDQATEAPLMEFIRASAIIEGPQVVDELASTNPRAERFSKAGVSRNHIRRLLPSPSEVNQILEATCLYWQLWPLHPSQLSPASNLSLSVVTIARSFIEESLERGPPDVMARALIWFALCIQQVPRSIVSDIPSLAESSSAVVMQFLSASDALLGPDVQGDFTQASLTCLVLQAKCYVNMGRLRQAWLATRRAVNQGIILGFHDQRKHLDHEDGRIWHTIWAHDSQLSLLLGVPSSLPPYCTISLDLPFEMPPEASIMHHISVLCEKINARNQNHRQYSYADTMTLDNDLDKLRAMIPEEWWKPDLTDKLPLPTFHVRQASKLYYHHLKQLIHIPYMLKATTEAKYQYSRTSVLEALGGMMECYAGRRLHPNGQYAMCFLVDFLAFSAGLILAADLLSQQSTWGSEVELEQWQSIRSLIKELRIAATLLDHTVAQQAAQLLEYLDSARHGAYHGPDVYDAVVPYYGKVRIRRPQILYPSTNIGLDAEPGVVGTVAFDSNIYDFNPSLSFNAAELDRDWASLLGDDITYDWTGVFEF